MAMKQIGTAVLFPGTEDETWGICESSDIAYEGTKKEIQNGEGDTVGLLYTDEKRRFSGVFTPLAAATAADPVKREDLIGAALEVKAPGKTLKIYIDNATLKRKKGDVPEFTIDGYYYPNIQTGAAPAGG